jgi:hypothetical protein
VISLARYLAVSCLHAQRWAPPGVLFLLGLAVTYASGGGALTTLAEGTAWLLPVTAWLTVTTLNDEHPSQAAITAAAAGGVVVARVTKLFVAGAAAVVLVGVSLAAAYLNDLAQFTAGDLAAGLVAHLLAVAAGVSLGSWFSKPFVVRPAWGALGIVLVTIIDVIVPGVPPLRAVLSSFDAERAHGLWSTLGIAALETTVIATFTLIVSTKVAARAGAA